MTPPPKFLQQQRRPDLWCIACGKNRLSVANVDFVCDSCKFQPKVISVSGIHLRGLLDEPVRMNTRIKLQAKVKIATGKTKHI